jgi:hypothetical protein
MYQLRVWSEELADDRLRITWSWINEPDPRDPEAELELVRRALQALPSVKRAKLDNPGLVISSSGSGIEPAEVARVVRATLGAIAPLPPPPPLEPEAIRVFAEDLDDGGVRLSWELPPEVGARDGAADRRVVAAWLTVQPAVSAVGLSAEGVSVRYDAERMTRKQLAELVRRALCAPGDLSARVNDLLRRAPTYANLARSAALDQRISPLPDVARQASQQRAAPASTALRFVPGFSLISRMQMLLPVIQGLSAWSREAPPGVVDEHLARAGITREQLLADQITAEEAKLFAREAGAGQAARAGAAARGALDAGRNWFDRRTGRVESS